MSGRCSWLVPPWASRSPSCQSYTQPLALLLNDHSVSLGCVHMESPSPYFQLSFPRRIPTLLPPCLPTHHKMTIKLPYMEAKMRAEMASMEHITTAFSNPISITGISNTPQQNSFLHQVFQVATTNELKLALETCLPSRDPRKVKKEQRGFLREQSTWGSSQYYRSKAFSSRSRCLFIAALLSQSSCKLWLILFTRSSSAFLSAKCLERRAQSACTQSTGKGTHNLGSPMPFTVD